LASAAEWMVELKSGQALTRLFAERGAQVAAIVLLLLLGLDSALILTRAFSQPSALPPASASRPAAIRPSINPTLQLAVIVNAHLFGVSGVTASGDAPTTTMPLVLAGVIADKDPAKGQAIIGENAGAAKLYAVGGAIPGGAHLHAVYSDRVLLERNGGLETLKLPRTPQSGSLVPQSAQQQPSHLAAAAASNPTLLAGLVRVQPVFSQGKLSGYRIFPGGTKSGAAAFSQLGLRAGDLIEAVNGTPLDDATRAMEVLQTLGSSATATITVSRNGASQEVNLNLAALNIEPDTGDNATPGQSTEAASGTPAVPPPAPGARIRGGGPPNLGAAPGSPPGSASNMNSNSTGADAAIPEERER
jgi:general secretion pathway protein C